MEAFHIAFLIFTIFLLYQVISKVGGWAIRSTVCPGRSLITAIYKSEGAVHARGNDPLMLAYFLLVLCLRKNIRAVHAYKNVECIDACTLKLFIIKSLDQGKGKR